MLTHTDILIYFNRLNLSSLARREINRIRDSPPYKVIRSGTTNVVSRYPSRKMGHVIQARSHRIQLPGIYLMEYDPDVLEYWDIPGPIKHEYALPSGKSGANMYTPTFFTLRTNAVGWDDWQSERQLTTWSTQNPNRYAAQNGVWHCPPGERYAERFGFYYHVHSDSEINWVLQRNLIFLGDFLRNDYPPVGDESIGNIRSLVQREPGIRLSHLIENLGTISVVDDIYSKRLRFGLL